MAEKRSTHKHTRFRTGRTPKSPEAIPDGYVRCPGCGRPTKVRASGRLANHFDGDGIECPQKAYGREVHLDVIPPVVLPNRPPMPKREFKPLAEDRPVTRVVTGRCHECDRPVSGERQFCGPCLARRI